MTVIARTTPSPGTEASFMQQLLGNIGRFNPTGIGGAGTGGGSSGGAFGGARARRRDGTCRGTGPRAAFRQSHGCVILV